MTLKLYFQDKQNFMVFHNIGFCFLTMRNLKREHLDKGFPKKIAIKKVQYDEFGVDNNTETEIKIVEKRHCDAFASDSTNPLPPDRVEVRFSQGRCKERHQTKITKNC